MTTAAELFSIPTAPEKLPQTFDPRSMILSERIRELLFQVSDTSSRSLQVSIGASEIGGACPRQVGYRMAGARPVSFTDPLRSLVGTAIHGWLAEVFRDQDHGSGRYLVEHPVEYQGIPGTLDLYDRRHGLVVDWKTTTKGRLAEYRRNGPSPHYVTQLQVYGAGLAQQGETPTELALVFIPTDGTLAEIWSWVTRPDLSLADRAITAAKEVAELYAQGGAAALTTAPALCNFCPFHRPGVPVSDLSCPGHQEGKPTT